MKSIDQRWFTFLITAIFCCTVLIPPVLGKVPRQDKITLQDALNRLHKKHNVFFTYDKALTTGIEVEYAESNATIEEDLSKILEGTNLKFKIFEERFVIIYQLGSEGIHSLKTMVDHFNHIIDDDAKKRTKIAVPTLSHKLNSVDKYIRKSKSVNGVVIGSNGKPLTGVNVAVKGKNVGTSTDIDGKFSLVNVDDGDILIFTYIGYSTLEIEAQFEEEIIVTLLESTETLEEVVVVGYGTMKKSDLTGAAVSANIDDFADLPNTNAFQALQGSVAGLNVGATNTSGSSPTISIRGQNTLSSAAGDNAPLIVVDGIIYRGSLADINPNNIQSMDVLKDASSAAIYGSQSSNGVILITTKNGEISDKPIISYSGVYSIQSPSNKLEPLSADEYEVFLRDAYWTQAYLAPNYTELNPDFDLGARMRSTAITQNFRDGNAYDWWGNLTGNGSISDHSLSISQRYKNFNYFISGGITDQQGFIINDDYKRYSGQINIGFDVTSWLNIGMESFLTVADYSGFSPSVSNSFFMVPWSPKFDANGELERNPDPIILNPFLEIQRPEIDKGLNVFGNLHADVKLPWVKGLNYRINFGQNYRTDNRIFFDPWGANFTGSGSFRNNLRYDYTVDNILSYNFTLNDKHDFSITGLYGVESRMFSDRSASAQNFQNDKLGFYRLQAGDPALNGISTNFENENSLYSMGRLFYSFDNKYLLTATVRRDGFSGFGSENKIGYFPSMAVGWVLSEENFVKGKTDWLDYLKLRASYGVTARRGLSRYETLAKVSSSPSIIFGDGGSASFGQWISSLANNELTWETTKGLNLGLDFDLGNSKLYGSVDYYRNNTEDILYNIQIPNITGFSSIPTNIGKVANHGLEFVLSSLLVRNSNFSWTSSVNFSRYRNEIVSILGFDNDNDGVEDDLISNRLFIGEPQSVIFDYETNGIWQLSDESEGSIPNGFFPGTYKIIDQNGDGAFTPDDRKILGYQDPAYRLSWSNKFQYKDFTLFVFINSIQGGKDYYYGSHNPNSGRLEKQDQISGANGFNFDYWTPRNPNAEYRRLDVFSSFGPGVYRQRNFIRLQDVSLSYRVRSLESALNLRSLSMFVSGKNLLTITDWDGWDPEIGGNPGSGLPVLRNMAFGINLEF